MRLAHTTIARAVLAVGVPLAALLVTAPAAGAVECGKADPKTKLPARATLTLDDKSAVTNLVFKRHRNVKQLSLVYNVTGCDLTGNEVPPAILVLPRGGGDQLPDGVVTFKRQDTDGSAYFLSLAVDAHKFDPGSYDGLIVVRARYLAPNRTPIAVSRSENSVFIPILIGGLAGLAGIAWFAAAKFLAREKLDIATKWVGLAVALAILAGIWAALKIYTDQDVWTFDDNWRTTAIAGFTGASTGAMAAVLAALWKAPAKEQPKTGGGPADKPPADGHLRGGQPPAHVG